MTDLGFDGRSTAEISHVNLTALSIHHNGDSIPLILIQLPQALNHVPMPVARAVAHVEPRDVHAAGGEGLELVGAGGGGADGADELGAARAAESILPELGFGDGVDLDGGGGGVVGGGGGAVGGDEDGGGLIGGGGGFDGEGGEGGGGEREAAVGGGGE